MKIIITESQYKKIIKEQKNPCLERYTKLVGEAVKWWKNWLNNPKTEEKWTNLYGSSSSINPNKHPYSFIKENWFDALDNIKIIPYNSQTKVLYDSQNKVVDWFEYKPNTAAFVSPRPFQDNSNDIYVNCDVVSDEKMILQTLIHEIQHVLDKVFDTNDMTTIDYKYIPKNPSKISGITESDILKEIGTKNFTALKKLWGNKTLELYNRFMKWVHITAKDMDWYLCDPGEKLSNLYAMRKLFNIQPGQSITVQNLLPYLTLNEDVDDDDVYLFLSCWVRRNFPPIDEYLNDFNALAAKSKLTSNTV